MNGRPRLYHSGETTDLDHTVATLAALGGLASATAAETAMPVQPIKNAIPYAATPLPLSDVRLTGGPLKHAQDLELKYLLELEPDRMLAYFRVRAGLESKAKGYGGWDGDGKNLPGHILGHYLSAVSLMWAATGDERFKERADYIVNALAEVHKRALDARPANINSKNLHRILRGFVKGMLCRYDTANLK